MSKGASIKFTSYPETVTKLLNLLKLEKELKKYDKVVLKVSLNYSQYPQFEETEKSSTEFIESVLKFVLENKNPVAEVFIAEGADGPDTNELFDKHGFRNLAEKYSVGLVDLNNTETEETYNRNFTKFTSIHYPKILKESFVISLTKLSEDPETDLHGSLSNMLGAFPSKHYSGFFSSKKNKIRKWPIKYSINDIVHCKVPEFAIIDASDKGYILAGLPLEMDKQSSKLLGMEWKEVPYLRLLNESLQEVENAQQIQ